MPFVRVSVGDAPDELKAAILAMKKADSEVRTSVSARMRETMNPEWRSGLSQNLTGSSRLEGRVLTAGARIAGGNPASIVTASSRKGLGSHKGIVPADNWPGYEYGATDRAVDMVSKKGKKYSRHVMRHLPSRVRPGNGRVIEKTLVQLLPRIAAYWVQSVVRAFMDAAEKR